MTPPPLTPEPPEPPALALGTQHPGSATNGAPSLPVAAENKVLETVGDVVVASYPPVGFERLTSTQRALAYHLSQAILAGDPLFTMQTSKSAWAVTQLVVDLQKDADLDLPFREALALYRKRLFINHGLHDAITGQKVLPTFTRQKLSDVAKARKIALSKELLNAMFDPKVGPTLTQKTPPQGKDPIVESAANHYEGVTSKDLVGFKDKYPLNGRVVKQGKKLVEQVYRAGGDGAPPGLGDKELGRVVKHLEDAITLAPPEQQESLRSLVHYFRTGDAQDFQSHDKSWLKQVFPVDYILGFVETYTDVREVKGGFEGFLCIQDPARDPPLQALAKNAQYFEQKMPWDAAWKRDSFNPPAAAAVNVLAAAGDAGPMTFIGVNLPNGQELRQKYGSKNFVVLSVMDLREELSGKRTITEFAPEETRADMLRCSKSLEYALSAFHEVTGHGSGKVSPSLAGDPSTLLAPYYSAMEEGRAELVADYLSGDPKTIELGLLPDAGCQKVLPSYVAMMTFVRHRTVPEGDVAEEDHFRADLIQNGYLMEKGIVTSETRGGKRFLVVKDPEAWRKANGELLAEHQRIKANADKAALKALVDKHGTHIDTTWRDEVRKRLEALSLPRATASIPPILTPILDASGKVVDAKAEQATSLGDYLAYLEKAWK